MKNSFESRTIAASLSLTREVARRYAVTEKEQNIAINNILYSKTTPQPPLVRGLGCRLGRWV
ncbi:MAG: hypothetical protein PUB11_04715 [Oscillospiraceae bacterium]|nr:hypothetical protein [Oscillospiraceae bacterium]